MNDSKETCPNWTCDGTLCLSCGRLIDEGKLVHAMDIRVPAWTVSQPTQVGHYWYRYPDGAVCVIEMFDSWIAHGHPSLRGKGEWAGPLIVPV